MSSNSETGHAVNIANFGLIIMICEGHGAWYNPTNPLIFVANMKAQLDAATALQDAYMLAKVRILGPRNDRAILYEKLISVAKRSVGVLESSEANTGEIERAKSLVRLITGSNVRKKKGAKKRKEGAEERSNSHLGFVMRLDNFVQLQIFYAGNANYAPNEADLKVGSMQNLITDINAMNETVEKREIAAENLLIERNKTFYKNENCLIDVSLKCKKYVMGLFGARSEEAKSVTGIKLRRF